MESIELTFAIFREVYKNTSDFTIQFIDEKLIINGNRINISNNFYKITLEARIKILAREEGVPEEKIKDIQLHWSNILTDGKKHTYSELIAPYKNQIKLKNNFDSYLIWRKKIQHKIEKIVNPSRMIEFFDVLIPDKKRKQYLECGYLLNKWPNRLLNEYPWAVVESPIPGIPPLILDEVWIDLEIIDSSSHHYFDSNSNLSVYFDPTNQNNLNQTMPILSMLNRIDGLAILNGPSGSGKTTVLKWLARKMITTNENRFLLPLFISLNDYSQVMDEFTLVEFALKMAGVRGKRQIKLWTGVLSKVSSDYGCILILLDGWNEISDKLKKKIKIEINILRQTFSILLTSRSYGDSHYLEANQNYEICKLSTNNLEILVRRFFSILGNSNMAKDFFYYIFKHRSLFEFLNYPFILIICCSVWFKNNKKTEFNLPITKTALYHQVFDILFFKLTKKTRCALEYLAFWLLEKTTDAPRYFFDKNDVLNCCGTTTLIDPILKSSRIISQWSSSTQTFHFLHPTFHHYLAARYIKNKLIDKSKNTYIKYVEKYFYSYNFREILEFLAGEIGCSKNLFWQKLSEISNKPDCIGFTYVILSQLLKEAQINDGGKLILGTNIKNELWSSIIHGFEADLFIHSFIALDDSDLLKRIQNDKTNQCYNFYRVIGKKLFSSKLPKFSNRLVNDILTGKDWEHTYSNSMFEYAFDNDSLIKLRNAVSNDKSDVKIRKQAIRALGFSKDHEIVDLLLNLTRNNPELANETIQALCYIRCDKSLKGLISILKKEQELITKSTIIKSLSQGYFRKPQGYEKIFLEQFMLGQLRKQYRNKELFKAVEELALDFIWGLSKSNYFDTEGNIKEINVVNSLLAELASLPLTNTLSEQILKSFNETNILKGNQFILQILKSNCNEKIRALALNVFEYSNIGDLNQILIKIIKNDESNLVKKYAIMILRKVGHVREYEIIYNMIKNKHINPDNDLQTIWTLFEITDRLFKSNNNSRISEIHDCSKKLIIRIIKNQNSKVTILSLAILYAHLVGANIGKYLIEICKDENQYYRTRELACFSLGRLHYQPATETSLQLIKCEPNIDPYEWELLTNFSKRLSRAAALSLTYIDPGKLLQTSCKTGFNALAHFSRRTGNLIYSDYILDANGQIIAGKKESELNVNQSKTLDYDELTNSKNIKNKLSIGNDNLLFKPIPSNNYYERVVQIPTSADITWSQIQIYKVDGNTVAIYIDGKFVDHYGHIDLGMAQKRKKRKKKKLWDIIEELCENYGYIPWKGNPNDSENIRRFGRFKERVSKLRKLLQYIFDIKTDPFLECSRSNGLKSAFQAFPNAPEEIKKIKPYVGEDKWKNNDQ